MLDRYSKAVLTVIAVALTAIAAQQFTGPSRAQSECGTAGNPCVVSVDTPSCGQSNDPCYVVVDKPVALDVPEPCGGSNLSPCYISITPAQ